MIYFWPWCLCSFGKENQLFYLLEQPMVKKMSLLLHFIIMEPPPRLLRRSAVSTVLYIAVIIFRALLQASKNHQKDSIVHEDP